MLLLLFSYWVGDGVLYPLGVGVFLALFYLVLVGLVFFFHVIPNVKRRVLEAAVLVGLFAAFYVYPPLSLAAILAALFVLLYPVDLGLKHGVFKDLTHVVLWFVLSVALGVAVSWPLPRILWINVLAAVLTALLAHYILLKTYPHLEKRYQKPAAT
jgi:ABC-type multidrug transport system fused ATPase/permease subunit